MGVVRTVFLLGLIMATLARARCVEEFETLAARLDASGCTFMRCYDNAINIVSQLKAQPGVDVDRIRVLHVSHFGPYKQHALVEYDGFIIDVNFASKPGENNTLVYKPVREFLRTAPIDTGRSRILQIPADVYARDHSASTVERYFDLLHRSVSLPPPPFVLYNPGDYFRAHQ